MTEKLYDTDAYLASFSAEVLSCESCDGGFEVILGRTAFFPEGGGQKGDSGSLGDRTVLDTQIRQGRIFHRTDGRLTVGQTVEGKVNFSERFRRMQNHSGEHIVSGIVHSRFGYENVGFHLGDREMMLDFSGELTESDLISVEEAANRAVWENREIRCFYPEKEALNSLVYRSKKELSDAVRIVCIDGIDTCACCAPHVRRTGEIGGIVITDACRWKGGMRLTVRCGSDALDEYTSLRRDEKSLSALFSASQGSVFSAAAKLKKEYTDLRREYGCLLKKNALQQVASLPETEGNLCLFFSEVDGDVLRAAATEGIRKCSGVFVSLSGNDDRGYQYVISAHSALRAEPVNQALRGRGGGRGNMIQGSFFATEREIREFFKEFQI